LILSLLSHFQKAVEKVRRICYIRQKLKFLHFNYENVTIFDKMR